MTRDNYIAGRQERLFTAGHRHDRKLWGRNKLVLTPTCIPTATSSNGTSGICRTDSPTPIYDRLGALGLAASRHYISSASPSDLVWSNPLHRDTRAYAPASAPCPTSKFATRASAPI